MEILKELWWLVAVVLFTGGLITYLITIYNSLVRIENNVKKSWANIDVLLNQRHDETPKLVKVCAGYGKFEKETLEKIIQARSMHLNAVTVGQKVEAEDMLNSALGRLFAVAESYPDLKANELFNQLQQRIINLEENIADRRELYNESVNIFNIRIQQLPDVLIARFLNYEPQEMFKVEEHKRQDVDVNFNFA